MRFLFVSIFLVLAGSSVTFAREQSFSAANSRGVVGETDHLALVDSGIAFRPYYNDYAGGTDKYLTHASILSAIMPLSSVSLQAGARWRLITPNLWEPLAAEDVESQPAPFADWMSAAAAIRVPTGAGNSYVQMEYERGKFGHYGGDRWQRKMHDTIRKYTEADIEKNEYWTPRSHGKAEVIGAESGTGDLLSDSGTHLNIGVGFINSPLTRDRYIVAEYLNFSEPMYHWSGQSRLVRQFNSTLYEAPLQPWRVELALAWRYKPWLVPSVKVISPIFREDARPQIYIDPINLNLSF